ncbi:MAG: Gfo/Idh/MocA family oxidoreductase [Tannerella sp.]|jgi:predicted dehydrogenase|nr:Gfo/Idh/MocA family oxidoreductase [Tannerella sp.]
MSITRRNFLKTTAVAAMALPTIKVGALGAVAAGDKLNAALIGCRNMGWGDLTDFLVNPDTECVALCDIDANVLNERAEELVKMGRKKPDLYGDYRKMLERKDVDVVIIGTPDHWHCLQMVDACAAGKDVYVEKPAANSIAECDAMTAAAKKYQRVVQVGQQQRSSGHWKQMVEYLRGGALGTVGRVHIWGNFNYAAVPPKPDADVPAGVDFETWLGPTPARTFNPQRFHGLWRMFWDYGGGLMTDWGVHLLDMGLWGLNVKEMPNKIVATGGKFYYPEGMHETLDSQTVSYLFDDCIMSWEHNAGVQTGPYNRDYGVLFKGTNGTLVADRENWEVIPEQDGNRGPKTPVMKIGADHQDHKIHLRNFIDCVKTRNFETACTIENGSLCAKYAHLGNIAARLNAALVYDDVAKSFVGAPEANKYLKPAYRAPWKFPNIS